MNYHYFMLASKLLHTHPDFFIEKKIELEEYVLLNAHENYINRNDLEALLLHGCISDFWSENFKLKMKKMA